MVTFAGLAVGTPAVVEHGVLRTAGLRVDLRTDVVWSPTLVGPAIPRAREAEAHRRLVEILMAEAPAQSLARLLAPWAGRTRDGAGTANGVRTPETTVAADAVWREAVCGLGTLFGLGRRRHPAHGGRADGDGPDAREDRARAAIETLAGRGPGLTPSGDDFLVGVLHAVTCWPDLAAAGLAADLHARIAAVAVPRTTRISAAYLDAASRGWATSPWHALVDALAQYPAAGPLEAAARRLLATGETSGADGLTGFCWAWAHGLPG